MSDIQTIGVVGGGTMGNGIVHVAAKAGFNVMLLEVEQRFLDRAQTTIAKNLVGVVLILAGIVMLIGPGQGVLTILIGLIMVDIPGKRPIEAKIIGRPGVLAAANNLRERYGKPPLVLD